MKVAVIPARFGSKRIKKKNIKIFYSKPIIYWTIKKIRESKLFDFICVSSDSDKILNIAMKYGVEILIKRPKNLSGDRTPTKPVIIHAINEFKKMKIQLEKLKSQTEYMIYKNKILLFTHLKHVVECTICYETKLHIDLTCAHTFCIDCYPFLYKNICPLCRM